MRSLSACRAPRGSSGVARPHQGSHRPNGYTRPSCAVRRDPNPPIKIIGGRQRSRGLSACRVSRCGTRALLRAYTTEGRLPVGSGFPWGRVCLAVGAAVVACLRAYGVPVC